MKRAIVVVLFIVGSSASAWAVALLPGGVQLLCHRTANEDVPENTMESLQQAVLLGCNLVEIDIRQTLDGELVLNHDGVLERLTDGVGEAEDKYFGELEMLDAGAWMGERFTGLRIPKFEDVVRYARDHDIRLYLDMKTKGMGPEILQILQREGMLQRVRFGGNWEDVKQLYSEANASDKMTVWVQPGVSAEQVAAYHREGKPVVVNFSGNNHDMDVASMKAAVAAGADAINVDYPRLGADAVGRPVERELHALTVQANSGESKARVMAILELAKYRGFNLQGYFVRWMLDPDDKVSRAATLALATARPRTSVDVFAGALHSEHADVRANAAWALGMMKAPAGMLLPLLKDDDLHVLQYALIAIAHMTGDVDASALLPLLAKDDLAIKGAAGLALARHQPDVAMTAVPAALQEEMQAVHVMWVDYVQRGKPKLSDAEAKHITDYYRSQLDLVQAISMLKGPEAVKLLEAQAFRPGEDFSWSNATVSAFQLWDRIGDDPMPAVQALASVSVQVANRAEWVLVNGGPAVLPAVRAALDDKDAAVRRRAIEIVAWHEDKGSLEALRTLQKTDGEDASLIAWAIEKIESLQQ